MQKGRSASRFWLPITSAYRLNSPQQILDLISLPDPNEHLAPLMTGVIEQMKKKLITFRKDEVYFSVGFFDPELSIPMIETYVFVGVEDDEFLFINAAGHLSGPEGELQDSVHYLALPKNSKSSMLDKESLAEWLLVEHSPKWPAPIEYEYTAA